MITLYFDVEQGELIVNDGSDNLIFALFCTPDGNFQSTLTTNAHERLIKKLVAAMAREQI